MTDYDEQLRRENRRRKVLADQRRAARNSTDPDIRARQEAADEAWTRGMGAA